MELGEAKTILLNAWRDRGEMTPWQQAIFVILRDAQARVMRLDGTVVGTMLGPPAEPKPRRMAANEDPRVHSTHRVEHDWMRACDVLPRCTPLPEPVSVDKDSLTTEPDDDS